MHRLVMTLCSISTGCMTNSNKSMRLRNKISETPIRHGVLVMFIAQLCFVLLLLASAKTVAENTSRIV